MVLDFTNIFISNLPAAQAKLGIVPGGGVPPTRKINTTAPLTGGGDFSVDRTHSMPKASAVQDGYLAAADFATFAGGTLTNLDGGHANTVYGGTTGVDGGNA